MTAPASTPDSTATGGTPLGSEPGARMARDMADQPAVLRGLLTDGRQGDRRGRRRGGAPPAAVRAVRRPGHQRPRRALRQVPRGDPARPAGRARLAVHAHRLRRPPRLLGRAGRRREPERRLARPGEVPAGRRRVRRADRRGHEQPRLAAERRPRRSRWTWPPAPNSRSRPPRPTPPSCSPCCCCSRACGPATAGSTRTSSRGSRRCPTWPRSCSPTPPRPRWRPAYRFANRLVLTGRGYAYPTAREAALKLMETSYVGAQAFSGADLLHGPLAMADPGLPVLARRRPRARRRGDDRGAQPGHRARRRPARDRPGERRRQGASTGSSRRRSTRRSRRCWTSCRSRPSPGTSRWPAATTRTRRAACARSPRPFSHSRVSGRVPRALARGTGRTPAWGGHRGRANQRTGYRGLATRPRRPRPARHRGDGGRDERGRRRGAPGRRGCQGVDRRRRRRGDPAAGPRRPADLRRCRHPRPALRARRGRVRADVQRGHRAGHGRRRAAHRTGQGGRRGRSAPRARPTCGPPG